MTELFDLTDKIAIVTGGGGGIGSALAKGLARHGADVAVTSRNTENLEPVAEEIRSLGKRSFAVTSDVTNEKSGCGMGKIQYMCEWYRPQSDLDGGMTAGIV